MQEFYKSLFELKPRNCQEARSQMFWTSESDGCAVSFPHLKSRREVRKITGRQEKARLGLQYKRVGSRCSLEDGPL